MEINSISQLLNKLAPFKIYVIALLIVFCLSEFYIAYSSFIYAAKKEDSPENLNAAVVKGVISIFLALAMSGFTFWLYFIKW